jgi:hypothetical protein
LEHVTIHSLRAFARHALIKLAAEFSVALVAEALEEQVDTAVSA